MGGGATSESANWLHRLYTLGAVQGAGYSAISVAGVVTNRLTLCFNPDSLMSLFWFVPFPDSLPPFFFLFSFFFFSHPDFIVFRFLFPGLSSPLCPGVFLSILFSISFYFSLFYFHFFGHFSFSLVTLFSVLYSRV